TPTHSTKQRLLTLIGVALLALGAKPAAPPQPFASPEAAVDALAQAARASDEKPLLAVFGAAAHDIVSSGDAVADTNARAAFAKSYDSGHRLEREGDAKAILVYGDDDFPFPIPLVKQGDKWHFDAAAGRHEILARRVGRNELATIQVCLAYGDAQREYASVDRDGDGLFEYAQRFASSSPKSQDGLYWPAEPGQPESPLGDLVADARSEGYRYAKGKRHPYHGYLYKILTKQGSHADGGAFDYIVRGNMIGGYALVAYPAEYGVSGIMTFVLNYEDVVFSKDLGANTAKIAGDMTRFDPDSTWKKED
ncbi:MAG TPA: DUF2950 domain-containing protein, partial [Myxococcota bacterium]|nr:DUF2950 domain-containing protein [Myxococcota bacterium]